MRREVGTMLPYMYLPLFSIVFPESSRASKYFVCMQGQPPDQKACLGPACPLLQLLSTCSLQLVLLQLDTILRSPVIVPISPTSMLWFTLCPAWMLFCEAFEVPLMLPPVHSCTMN